MDFILSDINYREVIDEYNSKKQDKIDVDQHTDICKQAKPIIFYNVNRYKIQAWVNMMSDNNNINVLPLTIDKPCWWCRHTFYTCPIGVPLKYMQREMNTNMLDTDYFEIEGVFCSFPCCKAYIIDESYVSIYKSVINNLNLLYYKLYNTTIDIPIAPSWKTLASYGGHLTIDQFRASFGETFYKITSNTKRPFMYVTGTYIEESSE